MLKKFLCLFLCLGTIATASGCANQKQKAVNYDTNAPINSEASQTVASNSELELIWNETNYCVMLRDIKSGKLWSTIPYEYITEQGTSKKQWH